MDEAETVLRRKPILKRSQITGTRMNLITTSTVYSLENGTKFNRGNHGHALLWRHDNEKAAAGVNFLQRKTSFPWYLLEICWTCISFNSLRDDGIWADRRFPGRNISDKNPVHINEPALSYRQWCVWRTGSIYRASVNDNLSKRSLVGLWYPIGIAALCLLSA